MTDVPEDAGVVIAFDAAVDPADLTKRAAFRPAVEGSWEAYGSGQRMLFKPAPDTGWTPLTAYTLVIEEAVWGAATEPFRLSFRTGSSDWPELAYPAWATDGGRLAVLARPAAEPTASYARLTYDLALATLGSRDLTRLAEGAQPWQRPVWTADGGALVFARAGGTPEGKYAPDEVWVVAPGPPPSARRLIPASDYAGPMWLAAHPAPGGRGYVVVANYGGVDAHSDVMQSLFIADPSGRKVRPISPSGGTQHFLGWVGNDGRFLFLDTYDQKNQSHYFAYDVKTAVAGDGRDAGGASAEVKTLLSGGPVAGFADGSGNSGGPPGSSSVPVTAGSTFAITTWQAYDTGTSIPHLPAGLVLLKADPSAPGGYKLVQVDLPGAAAWATPSPDGSKVVFACNAKGNWDLWVLDVAAAIDGRGQPRPLTATPDDDIMPAWSPDGRWIAFVLRHRDGAELKLVSPAGGEALDYWSIR
jgi:Tol biopolymer transport system component